MQRRRHRAGRHDARARGVAESIARGPHPSLIAAAAGWRHHRTEPDAMPQLRIRITGSDDDLRAVADLLQSLEGIEHVEEVADLMPQMDDEDSSSAGLSDDLGPGTHELEVDAPNAYTAGRVRELVEELAYRLGLVVEFVEEED